MGILQRANADTQPFMSALGCGRRRKRTFVYGGR